MPTVLVLRHHGLGDLVTAQPALRGLGRHFPDHRIVVTCPSWLVPLAEHFGSAHQFVSEVSHRAPRAAPSVDPSRHQTIDAALLDNVLTEVTDADVLVSLRTPGPELRRVLDALAPRLFVSYRSNALEATVSSPELDFSHHILSRWRLLLKPIGVDLRDEEMYADLDVPENDRGFTTVHVGAGSPSRQWPIDRWTEVVRHLESTGHRVVLTGSGDEAGMTAEVRRRAALPVTRDRAGATSILEFARLVAGARLVVCGDTGVSHLATAFRRPAVTLFGPVPPAWWGPPPGNPAHKTLWVGRTGDNYGTAADPGLLEISVASVLSTIQELQREQLEDVHAFQPGGRS
ncbi:MAG: glycosyltransferase family 9 protein [Gemmatimonadetes bacterium]|nr:glycosyltransferase family 9 protein [Gemmatimonadota bacterium]